MHLGNLLEGMLPAVAIVGGAIPLASGLGLAMKYRKTGNIVACFFGDGATNIGSFHEGVNIAAIWDLPVVFVCENNRYGASTAIEKRAMSVIKSVPSTICWVVPSPGHTGCLSSGNGLGWGAASRGVGLLLASIRPHLTQ